MSRFTITNCTVDDGPALAYNNMSAFWTDPTWVLIWRGKTLEHVISQASLRMAANLLTDSTHRRHLKAVDTATGKAVGYIRFVLPDAGLPGKAQDLWPEARVPEVGEERERLAQREFAKADWSFSHHSDALDVPITAMQERLKKGKNYLVLDYLAVHPNNKRKGIASLLVEAGVKAATEMGLDVFVLAFNAGLPVYLKAGFKLLDQIIQDDTKYGGKGNYGAYFLVKQVEMKDSQEGERQSRDFSVLNWLR